MSSELTAQIHQYLTTAPSSLFAQQEVEIVSHWQGDANLLWRVKSGSEDAVVKQFLDAGQARSRRQFDGQQIFAALGLAPLPLWADRYPHGLSRQLMVYRWSQGERIEVEDASSLWTWAEAVATLHSAPTEDVRRFSPHPLNLDFYWRIEQASIAQVAQWLAPSGLSLATSFQTLASAATSFALSSMTLWETAIPAAVHGDLSLEHTLSERGRILFLDWEMFGLGDPTLEVAHLLQRESQTLTADQGELWLESYLQSMSRPHLAERISIFQRLLEFHNVVYLLVGLYQNSLGQLDSDLLDALPFMQSAVSSALDRAHVALLLPELSDSATIAASFISWLIETAPVTR